MANNYKDPSRSPRANNNSSRKAEDPTSFVLRVRDDVLVRREYTSAIASIVPALEERNNGGERFGLNTTQKLRLSLLLADCFFITQRHVEGCEAAQAAVRLSNGLSPQAYFTLGREQFLAGRILDATQSFETAEMLIATGLGRAGAVEDLDKTDPAAAPQSPLKPTPEWADDLVPWRRYAVSANAIVRYASCGVIADSLVDFLRPTLLRYVPSWVQNATANKVLNLSDSSGAATASASASGGGGGGGSVLAIVIRNRCTHSRLRLHTWNISGGEFIVQFPLEKGQPRGHVTPLPNIIGPQEAAVVLWRQTGWVTFSSTVGIRYVVEDHPNGSTPTKTPLNQYVECYCEAQKFGKGKALCRSAVNDPSTSFLKTGICDATNNHSSGKHVIHIPLIRRTNETMKWLLTGTGSVASFSLCPVMSESNRLSDVELMEVLQPLIQQPSALKKLASVSRHVRNVVGLLPPPCFFFSQGSRPPGESCGPDYALGSKDWSVGPWIVPPEKDLKEDDHARGVTWRIMAMQDFLHSVDVGFVDRMERRILGASLHAGAGTSLDGVVLSAGPWRNSILTLGESWSSPSVDLLTPAKRTIAKLTIIKNDATSFSAICEPNFGGGSQIRIHRSAKGSETNFVFTQQCRGMEFESATLSIGPGWGFSKGGKFPVKGELLATLTLHSGAESMMTATLALLALVKC